MDKKNILSLVLGLVIGGLVVWLLITFAGVGATMVTKYSGKGTVTPTPTVTAEKLPSNSFNYTDQTVIQTDTGIKSVTEILAEAGVSTQAQGGGPLYTKPCDSGQCQWKFYQHSVQCDKLTCDSQCNFTFKTAPAGKQLVDCECPEGS